jgi:hypothetical protein
MKRMHALLILLAVGCGGGSSGSTDDDDSTDDGASADDGGPATAPSDDDDDDGPPSTGDDDDGESSSASTTDTLEGTSAADDDTSGTGDTGPSDETSGGPTNDCTNEKDPCVLELDVTAAGAGGVDQFFVYTVGDGGEHVEFTGIEGDYVSWFSEPWAFACVLDGPCCQSDGATTCDKPLAQEFLEFAPGDTAYVFVFANAPYELTITSG